LAPEGSSIKFPLEDFVATMSQQCKYNITITSSRHQKAPLVPRFAFAAGYIGVEHRGQVFTGCCPNPILITTAALIETEDFFIFFFHICINAQITIDYNDALC
jgi:hypothetical protein